MIREFEPFEVNIDNVQIKESVQVNTTINKTALNPDTLDLIVKAYGSKLQAILDSNGELQDFIVEVGKTTIGNDIKLVLNISKGSLKADQNQYRFFFLIANTSVDIQFLPLNQEMYFGDSENEECNSNQDATKQDINVLGDFEIKSLPLPESDEVVDVEYECEVC